MSRLMEVATSLDLEPRAFRSDLDYLKHARTPCILHWNMNHYVVLKRANRKGLFLHDPARGERFAPYSEATGSFTGVLLELAPGAYFHTAKEVKETLSLGKLTGRVEGLGRSLSQLLGFTILIEFLGLLLPFQLQWIVDDAIVTADTGLLFIIGAAFALLVTVQMGLNIARGWAVSRLSASLNGQWTINIFSHLMRLPLDFFEKRHLGDVISRFGSVRAIQSTLTGSFVDTVLGGAVGTVAFVVLCIYSVWLALIVSGAVIAYACVRWALYRRLWALNEDLIVYSAKQQSELMESVRGVQTIKLAAMLGVRISRFTGVTTEALIKDMKSQQLNIVLESVGQGIFGTQRVILLTLGALLAIRGSLSVGMFLAFTSYADQFISRTTLLVDRLASLRMLKLQLSRIADIALEAPEHIGGSWTGTKLPVASVELVGVSFRYSNGEPWIFEDLHLLINEGESIAIVGASGCGKSTLIKIIVGLIQPTKGRILVGGVELARLGLEKYRYMISAVMQDDRLFAGSIAENISLFEEAASPSKIEAAATLAEIHEEITRMPMGYETLVGDMGSSLSGGQRQRIIMARALYREAKILVLDEATSHLDVENERLINDNIRVNMCTKIVAAHRPDTIAMCDRVVRLVPGKGIELCLKPLSGRLTATKADSSI